MDYKAIYYGMISTIKTLGASLPIKLVSSIFLGLVMHKHALLFYAFIFLVFLDCFTRWLSISYKRLEKNKEKDMGIVAVFKGIKKARAEGLISSEVMKNRFIAKIAVYLICTMSAATVDLCMLYILKPTWAVATVISYLVLTELLSIVENLNEAGIEMLSGLIDILKRK